MIFDNLKELVIPEGSVIRIEHAGEVLWERILYVIQTITGINSITIPEIPNYKGGIVEITQYGKTEQNGTPTPSTPVDIVCNNGTVKWGVSGTNLLEMTEENIRLRYYINDNGVEVSNNQNFYNTKFIPVKPNTTYTLSVSEPIYYSSIMEYDSNKDFLQRTLDGSSSEKHSSMTINTRADTTYIRIGSNPSREALSMDDVTNIDWMLNEGSTALPYEPYTEGVIADGTPEVLSVGGKNLLKMPTFDEVTDTSQVVNYWNIPIKLEPNTTYYLSSHYLNDYTSLDENLYVLVTADATANKDFAAIAHKTVGIRDRELTTDNSGYLYFRVNRGATRELYEEMLANTEVQLERGSAATDYEPYREPQTVSVADLFAVGNYKDTQGVISGTITRQVGVKVLDGTEGFSLYQSSCWAANVLNDPKKVSGNGQSICSHYAWTDSSIPSMADSSFLLNGTERLCIKDSRFETAAQFKAYLADQYAQGTPVIVLYPLAEEITESATPQTITASGTTTISADSNHISDIGLKVDYYGVEK